MFKDSFKYYKSKKPPPNLENVIDIDKLDTTKVIRVSNKCTNSQDVFAVGLKTVLSWEIFEFTDIPGLIFIRNPFTPVGQRFWITKCLKDYSKKPNKLNIDVHNILQSKETWWDICTTNKQRGTDLIPKLRWATLGYHHNWDTKHYSEDSKTEIPEELSKMTKIIAQSVGFHDFIAEAAIINYYRMNSTLAGHVDHSEVNIEAPLISISFGQTAIFLIGGLSQNNPANAIFLRSGDVVIMSGKSRMCYHGVPRILSTKNPVWNVDDDEPDNNIMSINNNDWNKAKVFITDTRINMNVRQVLKTGQISLHQNF
ncbi:hypothetical protein PV327_007076 [Microctonus hyperodae]|uniref:Fe2OG dioxygenase domain-containing protein n=1 Tax=Microctonus hyperodae TaxID=165561 RepID=A0AA39KJ95_MICHY|nr:hypothetical protein PV327_007076 [Microctonus hyperodae]